MMAIVTYGSTVIWSSRMKPSAIGWRMPAASPRNNPVATPAATPIAIRRDWVWAETFEPPGVINGAPRFSRRDAVVAEDDGHIICRTPIGGGLDERGGRLVHRPRQSQDPGDLWIAHAVGQAVGAQQHDVAVDQLEPLDVDPRIDLAGAERIGQNVLQIRRGAADVHQVRGPLGAAPGQRVVVRQLDQVAVAVDIRARVSDVCEEQILAAADEARERGVQGGRQLAVDADQRRVDLTIELRDPVDDVRRDVLVDADLP